MERTITVKGVGKVSAKPDLVVIHIGLVSEEPDYGTAMEQASRSVDQLYRAIENHGFEKNNLKTTNFNAGAVYDSERDRNGNWKQVFRGFQVSHDLKLSFDLDMKRLAEALSGITGTLLHPQINISFTVKNPADINEELLRSATKNARKKAEVLCEASGVRLGNLLAIDYNWAELEFTSHARYALPEACMEEEKTFFSADIDPEDIEVSDTAAFVWEIGE